MAPTKILLFGSTGPTGLLTLQRVLDAGCEVIAYVRSPNKLPESARNDPHVTVVHGTLTDRDQLSYAFSLHPTVVVSLIGPAGHEMTSWLLSPSTWSSTIYVDFYRLLLSLMREHSVRRIYAMGTLSIYAEKDLPSLGRWFMATTVWLMAHGAWNNMIGVGRYFQEEVNKEEIDWTVFRLGGLYDQGKGETEGKAHAGHVGEEGSTSWVSREGIAEWLVEQVTGEGQEWKGEMPYLWTGVKNKKE